MSIIIPLLFIVKKAADSFFLKHRLKNNTYDYVFSFFLLLKCYDNFGNRKQVTCENIQILSTSINTIDKTVTICYNKITIICNYI